MLCTAPSAAAYPQREGSALPVCPPKVGPACARSISRIKAHLVLCLNLNCLISPKSTIKGWGEALKPFWGYYIYVYRFLFCCFYILNNGFCYCHYYSPMHQVMAPQAVLIKINSALRCKQQPRLLKVQEYWSPVSFLTSNAGLESLYFQPDSPSGTQSSCLWDHNAGREQLIKISALCHFLPFLFHIR